ncbi:hypothetical protein [Gilvimarinus agarilyticus]|uniref:hypothetical protein n=1 Tax=Gilvimarinus agarilyticus TaxID=679259 RepID=UPI0005A1DD83|nr:hypothetical protein [Gilvimarinus agarilyticus]
MDEDWRNYTPEYNYESKSATQLSIILVSTFIGDLAVILFAAGYWIKLQVDRHEREQIKKEFIGDMNAAKEVLRDPTLTPTTRKIEFKPIGKPPVQENPYQSPAAQKNNR